MFQLKTRSVYIGFDMGQFGEARAALETAKIRYSYKVRNHQSQFLYPGRGTVRGAFGSLGTDQSQVNEYEIKVAARDEEQARDLIQSSISRRP